MANTIKFKRASGSDPSASDLAIGEPGLRTDTAELFFKKDDGTVAKVSGGGGGPNFKYLELRNAANNGAASFPGNDFTLVTAGTTTAISPSAANTLLVSVSGVIQKPNAGTSTSGITGFIIDGSRFKTATNLPAAPDFIVFQESGGIGEPSDNTVTSAKIVDGAIVNADINASAAIAGTKIDPDFGSQNIVTTGHLLVNTSSVGGGSYDQLSVAGGIKITDDSNSKLEIGRFNSSSATNSYIKIGSNSDSLRISNAADSVDLFTLTNSGNVGIGTTSPTCGLHIDNPSDGAITQILDTDNSAVKLVFRNSTETGNNMQIGADGSNLVALTGATQRMRLLSDGDIFLGGANTADVTGNSSSAGFVYDSDGGAGNHPFVCCQHASRSGGSASYIKFQAATTVRGTIHESNNGFDVSYGSTSDYRLKENVVTLSNAITRLKTLLPKRFNWIEDETNTLQDGFLAHEVTTAVPQAVTGTKDEVDENNKPVYQQIDQSKLVPLLVAAVQELIGKVEALEAA